MGIFARYLLGKLKLLVPEILLMKTQLRIMAVLCLLAASVIAQAQTDRPSKAIEPSPVWYQMINDTTTNFNEAVNAFRDFFENRELPEEPGERFGHDFFEAEFGLGEAKKREKSLKSNAAGSHAEYEKEHSSAKSHSQKYALEVKAFKSWYFDVQTWLRPDGSIVGPQERQAILDAQRRELKEIEGHSKRN